MHAQPQTTPMIVATPIVRDIADGVTLTPPQTDILALGLLDGPAVISMPTGGGKTWRRGAARAGYSTPMRTRGSIVPIPHPHGIDNRLTVWVRRA